MISLCLITASRRKYQFLPLKGHKSALRQPEDRHVSGDAPQSVPDRYLCEAYFASKVTADVDRHPTLDQLLRSSLDAAEIGLRAETKPDQARPGSYNLRAIVDLHDIHLEHRHMNWVGGLDLSLYLDGAPSAYKITRKIAIPDNQLAAALETGIVVDVSVELAKPDGDLRVVVQDDATGAGGSVRVPLRQ